MSKQLPPKHTPSQVEVDHYQKRLDEDVFKPSGDQKAKLYSIVIPPPNISYKLHLAYALGTTFKVNESLRKWSFPLMLVSLRQSRQELLKNELEEKIDG